MERKIGEIFEYHGDWYQCILDSDCKNCAFIKVSCSDDYSIGYCTADKREDNKDVIFKKLEKVGEPFSCDYYGDSSIMMQEYNLYNLDDVTNEDNIPMYITDYRHKRIAIEIKQNKEDMEEKNLKPFDLEAAKAGKPVCTRDGRKARIICFDAKCADTPIVALVSRKNEEEYLYRYYRDGKFKNDEDSNADLIMLSEKKEGWVNVYKEWNYPIVGSIHSSKEEAERQKDTNCIATIKIEWEE